MKWNDWCLRPGFCTCKAILGRGQPGLMVLILLWIVPLVQDRSLDLLTSSLARCHSTSDAPSQNMINVNNIIHHVFILPCQMYFIFSYSITATCTITTNLIWAWWMLLSIWVFTVGNCLNILSWEENIAKTTKKQCKYKAITITFNNSRFGWSFCSHIDFGSYVSVLLYIMWYDFIGHWLVHNAFEVRTLVGETPFHMKTIILVCHRATTISFISSNLINTGIGGFPGMGYQQCHVALLPRNAKKNDKTKADWASPAG